MLITETSSATPNTPDDDEISFLYSTPPSNNKGKSILIDHPPVDHTDDDDEIQLLFSTSWNRTKKRKSFIPDNKDEVLVFASSSKGIQETPFGKDQSKPKDEGIIDLDDYADDDDEIEVVYCFNKTKIENDSLIGGFGVGDDVSLVVCELCADEKKKNEFLTVLGCDHSYCFECISRYVASRLQENVVEISCPVVECEGVLGPEYCRSILPSEVYDRWGMALCEEMINPSQKFYCPYKECSALMIDDSGETGEDIRRMECPNCRKMFCVKCKVAWHEGIECEEFQTLNEGERGQEDIMLVNLAKKNLWKRCFNCKMYVQRSQGCNVMRCRCGCRFCYDCGGPIPICHCMRRYGYEVPVGGGFPGINPIRPIPPRTPQAVSPPSFNLTINQHRDLMMRMMSQRILQNQSANQSQANPSYQLRQMAPMQFHMMNAVSVVPVNETRPDANIQPPGSSTACTNEFTQASPSLAGTSHVNPVENLSASHALSPQEQMRLQAMQQHARMRSRRTLQDRSANQSQSNPSTNQLRQLMQFHMMNVIPVLPVNQTPPNPNIQPPGSSSARANEFTQASPSLGGTSHVDPMENLLASHTLSSQESFAGSPSRRRRQRRQRRF